MNIKEIRNRTAQLLMIAVMSTGALGLVACDSSNSPDERSLAAWTWKAKDLTVQFTNDSQNASFFVWDFGDLSPASSSDSPVHSYASDGSYTVRLKACPDSDATSDRCSTAEGVVTVSDENGPNSSNSSNSSTARIVGMPGAAEASMLNSPTLP